MIHLCISPIHQFRETRAKLDQSHVGTSSFESQVSLLWPCFVGLTSIFRIFRLTSSQRSLSMLFLRTALSSVLFTFRFRSLLWPGRCLTLMRTSFTVIRRTKNTCWRVDARLKKKIWLKEKEKSMQGSFSCKSISSYCLWLIRKRKWDTLVFKMRMRSIQ